MRRLKGLLLLLIRSLLPSLQRQFQPRKKQPSLPVRSPNPYHPQTEAHPCRLLRMGVRLDLLVLFLLRVSVRLSIRLEHLGVVVLVRELELGALPLRVLGLVHALASALGLGLEAWVGARGLG